MGDYVSPRVLKRQAGIIEGLSATVLTVSVLVSAAYLITNLYLYLSLIPALDYNPPVYYPEDQFVLPLGGGVLDVRGAFSSYTAGSNVTSNGILLLDDGDSVEVIVNPDNFTVGLIDRPGVAGTAACATITVTEKGITVDSESALPAPANLSTFGAGTVQDALESPFLTLSNEAELTGSRMLSHDLNDFGVTLGAGTLDVQIVPSGTANQNCTHIQSITFASGVRVSSCVSGPAPGAPNGPATLGLDGLVPISQLPPVFDSEYRGLWDANADNPSLSCVFPDDYYLFVNVGGNTTKGAFSTWESKDVIFCSDGTFGRITGIPAGVHTFNGRFNNVTAQFGDYTDAMIPFASGTLADVVNAPLIGTSPSTVFPNLKVLEGTPGKVSVVGATIGLVDIPFWNGTTTTLIGALRDVVMEESGRFLSAAVGPAPIELVVSTPKQVLVLNDLLNPVASRDGDVPIRLPQTTSPAGSVQFDTVSINGSVVSAAGVGTVTLPNSGNSAFVKTQGTFIVNGAKSFEQNLAVNSGEGIRLRNAPDTASLNIYPAPSTSGNFDLIMPNNYGTNGSLLTNTGSGATTWQSASTPLEWVSYSPSLTASSFASASLVFARRRGLGISGSLMQVMIKIDVTRSGTGSASINVGLPVGFISDFTFGVERASGFCQQTGLSSPNSQASGLAIEEANTPNVMKLQLRGSLNTLNGPMLCNFFYIIL